MSYSCRVCFCESDDIHEFISPCCCSGSAFHIHKICLNTWLETTVKTKNYYECQDCKCRYRRTEPTDLNNVVCRDTTLLSLLYNVGGFSLLLMTILACNFSSLLCMIFLMLVFIIFLMATVHYSDWVYYVILIGFLGICASNRQVKTLSVSILLVLLYSCIFAAYVNNGWEVLTENVKKMHFTTFHPKMYDNYLKCYVEGVI